MFRVLVLGGIALTACGGATAKSSPSGDDASSDTGTAHDAFPAEGPDVTVGYDAFPQETAPPPPDAFPTEGPAMIDSSVFDAPPDTSPPCFPQETAIQWDGCAPIFDGGVVDATTDSGPTDGGTNDGFPQEGPPPPPPDI
jgi:hypothetical protein